MADAYQAKVDVSFPRPIGLLSENPEVWSTEGVNYPAGSHILAENLVPRDRERAASGELDHLLAPSSLEEAGEAPIGDPTHGVFVAEHENEAHILQEYGHQVVPQEQELEAMSAGSDRARQYQEAVAAHGLDSRPMQEATQTPPERVPDEVLEGHETRSGMPTDREPHLNAGESQSEETPRARPGA